MLSTIESWIRDQQQAGKWFETTISLANGEETFSASPYPIAWNTNGPEMIDFEQIDSLEIKSLPTRLVINIEPQTEQEFSPSTFWQMIVIDSVEPTKDRFGNLIYIPDYAPVNFSAEKILFWQESPEGDETYLDGTIKRLLTDEYARFNDFDDLPQELKNHLDYNCLDWWTSIDDRGNNTNGGGQYFKVVSSDLDPKELIKLATTLEVLIDDADEGDD